LLLLTPGSASAREDGEMSIYAHPNLDPMRAALDKIDWEDV
jgi:hypothetical protein